MARLPYCSKLHHCGRCRKKKSRRLDNRFYIGWAFVNYSLTILDR